MNSVIFFEPASVHTMFSTVIAVSRGAMTPSVTAVGSLRSDNSTGLQGTGYNQDEIGQSNTKCKTQESSK